MEKIRLEWSSIQPYHTHFTQHTAHTHTLCVSLNDGSINKSRCHISFCSFKSICEVIVRVKVGIVLTPTATIQPIILAIVIAQTQNKQTTNKQTKTPKKFLFTVRFASFVFFFFSLFSRQFFLYLQLHFIFRWFICIFEMVNKVLKQFYGPLTRQSECSVKKIESKIPNKKHSFELC